MTTVWIVRLAASDDLFGSKVIEYRVSAYNAETAAAKAGADYGYPQRILSAKVTEEPKP